MSGNQNNTNGSLCFPEVGNVAVTLVQAFYLVISMLGIVFNVFVLMVFCLHKKACTVAEIYLSNLAGADLALMCCLAFVTNYIGKDYHWSFSEILCKLVPSIVMINAFCSIYFLVLVSIDRYVALVHPLSYETKRRPFYAKLGCVVVWGLGLGFSLPGFFYRKLVQDQSNDTECITDYTSNQNLTAAVVMSMFTFIIPVSIISFCTVRIIHSLRNRVMGGLNTQRMEQRATKLILLVLLAFLICWVPFHVKTILDILEYFDFLSCHIILSIFHEVSSFLAFFNSVLNPILYVIAGKNFRRRAKELFTQWSNKTTETTSQHAHT